MWRDSHWESVAGWGCCSRFTHRSDSCVPPAWRVRSRRRSRTLPPGLARTARSAGGASPGAHLLYLCTSTRWRAVTTLALSRSIEKNRPGRVTSRTRLPVTSYSPDGQPAPNPRASASVNARRCASGAACAPPADDQPSRAAALSRSRWDRRSRRRRQLEGLLECRSAPDNAVARDAGIDQIYAVNARGLPSEHWHRPGRRRTLASSEARRSSRAVPSAAVVRKPSRCALVLSIWSFRLVGPLASGLNVTVTRMPDESAHHALGVVLLQAGRASPRSAAVVGRAVEPLCGLLLHVGSMNTVAHHVPSEPISMS